MVFVIGRSVGVVVLAALAGACPAGAADFASYVNPFNGTQAGAPDFGTGGGARNTNPGPTVPLGMAQWGPDTSPASTNVGGGYAYDDTKIRGFSVRRLSGAGCANEGDVPFLPTTSRVTGSPVDPLSTEVKDSLLPSFSHADEAAAPGSYRVGLGNGVEAQLTATTRAGIGRFMFPAASPATVLINATGSRTGNSAGSVQIDPTAHEVTGIATSGAFCILPNAYRIYFAARFSRPFAGYGTWTRQSLARGSTSAQDSATGPPFVQYGHGPTAQAGAYLSFDTAAERTVEVRVGISFVGVNGARRNLDAETAGRGFDAVRASARQAWNRMLGRVEVAGGRVEDRRTFYSMLYHALMYPSTFSDVDGRYRGFDDEVHTADGYTQYADFSGWDVYRSQIPLLALVAPRQAADFVTSLLADQRESGWLPKWSVANSHSNVMTGDPAPPAIAHIWALGARRFDLRAALAAAVKGATQPGTSANAGYVERQGLEDYLRLGYVPHEKNGNLVTASGLDSWRHDVLGPDPSNTDLAWGSAATTLEYATADFAVARLAAAAGDGATCRRFLARSASWHNVFDSSIGYARPRWSTGRGCWR